MVRIASAVLLIAVVAGTIWWLPWWATLILAVGAAAVGGRELAGLAAHAGTPVSPGFLGLASGAAAMMTAVSGRTEIGMSSDGLPALLLVIMIAIGLIALVSGPPSPLTLTELGILCLAPLYVGMPLGAIARAHATLGPAAITWLIGVVATSDTAQYYTGRLFGIRKLAPVVSPAKTIEGAVGGLAASAVAGAAMASWGLIDLQPVTAALLALLLAGFGMCGDLFESLLKRSAGVKDSAALIPGHGGVLDRVDSYLFAGPVFYLFVRFVA
jgi:phosphatidate cytidylyltransferase